MKEKLSIAKLQDCIRKIDHKNGALDKYMYKLMEEVGELAEAVRKEKRMQANEIKGSIEEELVDVLYYTICLANIYDINLEECFYLKEEINAKKYQRNNIFLESSKD